MRPTSSLPCLMSLLLLAGCGGSSDDDSLGSTNELRFNNVSSDFNADATEFRPETSGVVTRGSGQNGFFEFSAAFGRGSNFRGFNFILPNDSDTIGKTYTLIPDPENIRDPRIDASYSSSAPGPFGSTNRVFRGNGGSITVVARNGTRTTIRLNRVTFAPVPNLDTAEGSFEISGTLTAPEIPQPQ